MPLVFHSNFQCILVKFTKLNVDKAANFIPGGLGSSLWLITFFKNLPLASCTEAIRQRNTLVLVLKITI